MYIILATKLSLFNIFHYLYGRMVWEIFLHSVWEYKIPIFQPCLFNDQTHF